ncbi:MAG: antA/AntB antirepressor family protein [Fusobacterium sp.]|uniref:antA/AntB antirepressor family protein n=1 Tax=Fusobacterium sp. TaxID=68766 RepID=UPI002A74CAD5|nr:antA/AntB antirepressor family protein [Fusobacterium sp.]MDY2980633.1 antA/AntB antirepressor family protein [Fusobacterium sp.]
MTELIKVQERDGEQLVSGRELHQFLENSERFSKWWERMVGYGFEENKDYTLYQKVHPQNKQEIIDYLMKISMAKEISMLQRNEKGKEARSYFIKCEEAWNSDEIVMARAILIQNKKILGYKEKIDILEKKIENDAPRVSFAETIEKASDCLLVREFSKLIATEGIHLGEKKLYRWFREKGFILKNSTEPTQTAVQKGLFKVAERVVKAVTGDIISTTTRITGKGQVYFLDLLKKEFLATANE